MSSMNKNIEAAFEKNDSSDFVQSLGRFLGKTQILSFYTDMGTAGDEKNGITLELKSLEFTRSPAVFCKETGKTFILDWDAIVKIAVHCGVAEVDLFKGESS